MSRFQQSSISQSGQQSLGSFIESMVAQEQIAAQRDIAGAEIAAREKLQKADAEAQAARQQAILETQSREGELQRNLERELNTQRGEQFAALNESNREIAEMELEARRQEGEKARQFSRELSDRDIELEEKQMQRLLAQQKKLAEIDLEMLKEKHGAVSARRGERDALEKQVREQEKRMGAMSLVRKALVEEKSGAVGTLVARAQQISDSILAERAKRTQRAVEDTAVARAAKKLEKKENGEDSISRTVVKNLGLNNEQQAAMNRAVGLVAAEGFTKDEVMAELAKGGATIHDFEDFLVAIDAIGGVSLDAALGLTSEQAKAFLSGTGEAKDVETAKKMGKVEEKVAAELRDFTRKARVVGFMQTKPPNTDDLRDSMVMALDALDKAGFGDKAADIITEFMKSQDVDERYKDQMIDAVGDQFKAIALAARSAAKDAGVDLTEDLDSRAEIFAALKAMEDEAVRLGDEKTRLEDEVAEEGNFEPLFKKQQSIIDLMGSLAGTGKTIG